MTGTADIGRGTQGSVRWDTDPDVPGTSQVHFTAEVVGASTLDPVLLVCGGRWWLARIMRAAVQQLGAALDAQLPRQTR